MNYCSTQQEELEDYDKMLNRIQIAEYDRDPVREATCCKLKNKKEESREKNVRDFWISLECQIS